MRPVFDPFVLPFVLGTTFVLLYCFIGMIRIIWQLPKEDRRKFGRSLRLKVLNLRRCKIWRRRYTFLFSSDSSQ